MRYCFFFTQVSDPHNSEYVADHWKTREWISGFTGSAGTAVVTLHHAALWTDSRYFIAAAKELAGSEFLLMKERVEGTPSISEWLASELAEYDSPIVGVDGNVNTFVSVADLKESLATKGTYRCVVLLIQWMCYGLTDLSFLIIRSVFIH